MADSAIDGLPPVTVLNYASFLPLDEPTGGLPAYATKRTPLSNILSPAIERVANGSSHTLSALTRLLTQVIWRSATTSAKTQNVPAASAYDGYEIAVKDGQGTARTYNIAVVPAGGTIEGNADGVILRANRGCVVLRADGANNDWMVV